MAIVPSGASALHLTVQSSDQEDIAKLLIEHRADLNAVDKNGSTPLELAINKGNPIRM